MQYTIGKVLDAATLDLQRRCPTGARNEAEILVGHVLGIRRADLYAGIDEPVAATQVARLDQMVAARCSGRPLQYITGVQGFRGLTLKVGPGVLVPRPETEMLVQRCLEILEGSDGPLVLDIGTGSGAIALSLATERPDCRVRATEISEDAFRWAGTNLRESGLTNVELHFGDLFSPLPRLEKGKFDLVVSNPPYLSQDVWMNAPAEVREHEPQLALLAGDEGMRTCVKIIDEGAGWLASGGHLVMETAGLEQWENLSMWFGKQFEDVRITDDLAGRPRFVEGRKP